MSAKITRAPARGLTLIEVMIAMFLFLAGILAVLAAMPSGVGAAHQIMFQDAAIHLSRSKFSEFRRDRIDPRVDLVIGSNYLDGSATPHRQEPQNASGGGWRDFAHGAGDTYENFDNIEQYQWMVDQNELKSISVNAANIYSPIVVTGPGSLPELNVTKVSVIIGMKSSSREQRFTQYMFNYGQ